MEAATSEGSQAPARQGHLGHLRSPSPSGFVVTAELPEIQTVTVWTPCCAPMSTLYNKETEWLASVAVCLKTVRMLRTNISDGTIPVGAISIVYSYIHVQPYAISGQKCLVRMTNYPLLCNVNDTKRLRREALKSGQ